VRLRVSDTGCGIPAKLQSRIFEPFFTTKEPGKGTGLGLATFCGIVRQAEGEIYVESSPGTGTVFEIDLPGVRADVQGPKANARPRPADSTGGVVLLVEDEGPVRDIARSVLENAGYKVVTAHDGVAALESSAA
jgi:two-component system cell cycle sensor histidine kinase/response regulator CckA